MLTNIICDKTRRKHMSHKSHIMKHNNYLYFQLLLNDISITFFKLKVYKVFFNDSYFICLVDMGFCLMFMQ